VSQAPFERRALTITASERLGAYLLLHADDRDGPLPAPGQFAMLATVEGWGGGEDGRPYLPRAFSYARHAEGRAQFLLEDVGPGTHRLAELGPGEQLWTLGPLGHGFDTPPGAGRAILVGGGIGIAPLVMLNDALAGETTALLGFRDGACAAAAALIDGALIATDDGSVGHHGSCADLLDQELERDADAVVYACGPPAMLEAVRARCAASGVSAQLALEAGMACGFGACFGCAVAKRGGGYLRVCVDGPVVEASELEQVPELAGAHA
jgi:dihydroorotate dehydrogenase electron transfer subunit